jgi:hypothetical protein
MAARKEQMSRRKFKRLLIPALAVMVAAAVAVPALAQSDAPRKATLKAVGKVTFKPNTFVNDTTRFHLDTVTIRRGGTLTVVDRTRQPPHTFSIVRKNQVPRTLRRVEGCFEGPCLDIFAAHGAIDPETGEEREPTETRVNAGKPGFNRPGDSVLIPPRGRAKLKITGSRDLYYICAIHPWMSGKVDVAG